MKLLLDTNVLVDLTLRRHPFFDDARRIFFLHDIADVELWASAKSFTDVFYLARKRFVLGEVYEALAYECGLLSICAVDGNDVRRALEACWPDFEDCLIYQAAQRVKADFIITRNEKDFIRSSVPVLSPADFLIYMRDELHLDYTGIEL